MFTKAELELIIVALKLQIASYVRFQNKVGLSDGMKAEYIKSTKFAQDVANKAAVELMKK